MAVDEEYHTGIIAAIGGAGAAIGAASAVVIDTDPVIGLLLAFGAGLVISGGLAVSYDRFA